MSFARGPRVHGLLSFKRHGPGRKFEDLPNGTETKPALPGSCSMRMLHLGIAIVPGLLAAQAPTPPQLADAGRLAFEVASSKQNKSGSSSSGANAQPGGRVTIRNTSLYDLVRNGPRGLSLNTGRFVMDATGLTGRFDLDLKWTPDQGSGNVGALTDGTSLFTAIQEQLGLRLEARQAPVQVLVVESAERPTED